MKKVCNPQGESHTKGAGKIKEKRTATTIQPKDRFGGLVVIKRGNDDKRGKARYWCNCDCGKRKLVSGSNLVDKKQVSCGCSWGGIVPVPRHNYMCVETGEVFESSTEAAKFAGVSNGWQIIYACSGKLKSTGTNPETGKKYHWEFVDITKNKFVGKTRSPRYKLYCVNTGKKYYSPMQAVRRLKLNSNLARDITDVCNHYKWTAGKDPETGEGLIWEWL